MPEIPSFCARKVADLAQPLTPDQYRDVARVPLDCCRDIIYATAREMQHLESNVDLWKKTDGDDIQHRYLLKVCLDSVVILTSDAAGDPESRFDELAAFEDVLYVTAAKIHALHADLKMRFACGFIEPDQRLLGELTAADMVDHLALHWRSLLSGEVLATLDFAVRKERLVAFKTEHNARTFLDNPKYASRYDQASITASIRRALDAVPFNEAQLTEDIDGLHAALAAPFNPIALLAHVAKKNDVALAGWAKLAEETQRHAERKDEEARRDSFDLESDLTCADFDGDDSFSITAPSVDIPAENVPHFAADKSPDLASESDFSVEDTEDEADDEVHEQQQNPLHSVQDESPEDIIQRLLQHVVRSASQHAVATAAATAAATVAAANTTPQQQQNGFAPGATNAPPRLTALDTQLDAYLDHGNVVSHADFDDPFEEYGKAALPTTPRSNSNNSKKRRFSIETFDLESSDASSSDSEGSSLKKKRPHLSAQPSPAFLPPVSPLALNPYTPVLPPAPLDSPHPGPVPGTTPFIASCAATAAQHEHDLEHNPGRLQRHRQRALLKLEGKLAPNDDMKRWDFSDTCCCPDDCSCAYWCHKEPWHMCACVRPVARIRIEAPFESEDEADRRSDASDIGSDVWRKWEGECGVEKWW